MTDKERILYVLVAANAELAAAVLADDAHGIITILTRISNICDVAASRLKTYRIVDIYEGVDDDDL